MAKAYAVIQPPSPGKFMNDTEKFPTMLKKGKISLLPSLGGDRKTAKRIFKKVKKNKGRGK